MSGPSAIGKTTTVKTILSLNKSVTHYRPVTNRIPRPDEIENVDYTFVSTKNYSDFQEQYICTSLFDGIFYGYPRLDLPGDNVYITACSLYSAIQLAKHVDNVYRVFLFPSNIDLLKNRLLSRNLTHKEVQKRMKGIEDEIRLYYQDDVDIITYYISSDCDNKRANEQLKRLVSTM